MSYTLRFVYEAELSVDSIKDTLHSKTFYNYFYDEYDDDIIENIIKSDKCLEFIVEEIIKTFKDDDFKVDLVWDINTEESFCNVVKDVIDENLSKIKNILGC
jgi:hypothetical protein